MRGLTQKRATTNGTHLTLGNFMFGLLRIIRGFCGFLFVMQFLGLLPVFSWPLHPSSVTGGMLAGVLIKLLAIALLGWLFLWLRRIINRLHTKKHGVPHPSLAKNIWAL